MKEGGFSQELDVNMADEEIIFKEPEVF